jgi:16S rRNA C967 or C1407 C5-methylase (RsmB/RsmF family)/NOL1/NOP2/fmu family ribosome biogenesis protein
MNLPEKFASRMAETLGDDYEKFAKTLNGDSPVSIRFNPFKPVNLDNLTFNGDVLWAQNAKYLKTRPVFTLDPAFHAGAYYVQEASSMFLEFILKNTVDFSKPLKVLDMCAAPGGKTTTMASLLTDKDFLVANEVIKSRLGMLKENVHKWGFNNVIFANHDPETFADLEGFFDIVLVDAPCSGEGLFRKDKNAVNEWSEEHVAMCSARQKRIISAAALLVAPDGLLVYSTCTYNDQENILNVDWLTRTLDFKPIEVDVPEEWGLEKIKNGYQFYPHKVKGEGFFLAAFRSMSNDKNFVNSKITLHRVSRTHKELLKPWLRDDLFQDFEFFMKQDGVIVALNTNLIKQYGSVFRALVKRSSGLEIGIFKGNDFVPSHALALSNIISKDINTMELTEMEALRFLKKENFEIGDQNDGWVLITYKNLNLGWIKKIGSRINNYLPTEWRIRMDIE